MHLRAIGEGVPAVVMEASIGDFSLTWSLVDSKVGSFTRAVTYDRAGLGWSEVSPAARTGEVMVEELRQLLAAADIPGPFVLVGQSFSGLLVRLFAYKHPSDVAGIVLLDPAHEDQFLRFPEPIREAFGPLRSAQIAHLQQNAETIRVAGPAAAVPVVSAPPSFRPQAAAAYVAQSIADATRVQTVIDELSHLEDTQAQVRALGPVTLGEVPLTVISHGQPQSVPGMPDGVNQAYEDVWQQMQAEIAAMSARGKRIMAHESGHMIHHDQPDLVVGEVRDLVEAFRSRTVRH
jgi:pimeloyl-ACP methyl ester carboxylesterase